MRTPVEIADRLRASQHKFGWDRDVLSQHLSFVEARATMSELSPSVTQLLWEAGTATLSREPQALLAELASKMAAAWGPAFKGLDKTCQRNIVEMREICWLLGVDPLVTYLSDRENYGQWGRTMLKAIAQTFNMPVPPGA